MCSTPLAASSREAARAPETLRSTSLAEERTIARVKVLYVLIGMAEATILPFMALLLAERGFTRRGSGSSSP